MPVIPLPQIDEPSTLWRVRGYVRSHHTPPTQSYAYENQQREPRALAVLQMSLHGGIRLEDAQGVWDVPPGHACLFVYGDASRYVRTEQTSYTCAYMNFEGAGLAAHWRWLCEQFGSVFDMRSSEAVMGLWENLFALAANRIKHDAMDEAQAVMRLVMAIAESGMQRRAVTHTPAMMAARQLHHEPLSVHGVGELAEQYGCSREHFSRIFREQYGVSPLVYLQNARLHHAMSLIRSTDMPIHDIARQSGFTNTHRLDRFMRQKVGQNPTQLRASSENHYDTGAEKSPGGGRPGLGGR